MRMPSRVLIAVAILSLFAVCSCASQGLFKIPPKEYKKDIRRIVVIPVYIGSELFPILPPDLTTMDFDRELKGSVSKLVMENRRTVDDLVLEVLKNGRYKHDVVVASETEKELAKGVVRYADSFRTYEERIISNSPALNWKFSYSYQLDGGYVNNLLEKYKADAVFFHFLQVKKQWEWDFVEKQKYVISPISSLCYAVLIFGRDAAVLLSAQSNYDFKDHGRRYTHENDGYSLLALENNIPQTEYGRYKVSKVEFGDSLSMELSPEKIRKKLTDIKRSPLRDFIVK